MAKKKKAKKKVVRKKATKKKAKKKVAKKKATKKKAKKKVAKKKATKKKAKKKVVKKKATKKKAKKKVAKKKATKKVVKKKATKKKATKKVALKKTTATVVNKTISTDELKVYTPQVTIGADVPEFRLPATGDQTVSLSGLKGKKAVIFFYPRDATPGCTIEAHDFTRLKDDFESKNTIVYGVSRDSMKSHEKFKEKQNYKVELICDEKEELCAIFGAIRLKNMYGKKVRGIDRSTFVIDENGKLIKEWRTVKVEGHADEVLAFIKGE